jgi:hypothetical protein
LAKAQLVGKTIAVMLSILLQLCMGSDVTLQSESGDLSKSKKLWNLFSVCHAEIATRSGTSFPSVTGKPLIPFVRIVIEH